MKNLARLVQRLCAIAILIVFFLYKPAMGQDNYQFVWQNGMLFSVSADGKTQIQGTITGYLEKRRADGQIELIKTQLIPPYFDPSVQEKDETQESKDLRARIVAMAQASRLIKSGGFAVHQPAGVLTNDGFVFLVHNLAVARKVLELDQNQHATIERLAAKYTEGVNSIKSRQSELPESQREGFLFSELSKLRGPLMGELLKILLPHQVQLANSQSSQVLGIVRALSQTPIGESAGLKPDEKERIRKRSHEIASHLKQEIAKARRDMLAMFEEELSDAQEDKVKEFYPGIIERQINDSSVEEFLRIIDVEPRPKK